MQTLNFISGQIIDIAGRRIYGADIHIQNGIIFRIIKNESASKDIFLMPGFIDAHIHIESSMLVPYEFARIALRHGTVATISDPHEIANVLGVEGVQFMLDNAKSALLKFHFGAPSCVPATSFETAGAIINSEDVRQLLELKEIHYLSEMMNYPGVLNADAEVLQKIYYAQQAGKPVDGHAPGLKGDQAKAYIEAGISTDHECYTMEEALDKIKYGMKIIIREGSAARNFDTLLPLLGMYPEKLMFCSDDKHPDDLMVGHINLLVKRALAAGFDFFDVLRIACLHPIEHYNMNVGQLREGDPADFIVIDHPENLNVLETYINGILAATTDHCYLPEKSHPFINQFNINPISVSDIKLRGDGKNVPVIRAIDGELITEKHWANLPVLDGEVQPDLENDILKICVINRYNTAPPVIGFIKNFGLKDCALASTVAHDSHNIIVVGTDDYLICQAVNLLIDSKGGLSVTTNNESNHLPLQVAGLMSTDNCQNVSDAYIKMDQLVKQCGCKLRAPFMTLSFMALLVIPKIKISDKGMFDAESFQFL
ncbi:MAG: adenine deaminase [Saprospiraceae bacterium]|nr:adenine deaminase [Saprospiraceae bacterium]